MTIKPGQTAIVTGAARGFGFAIAKALAEAGVSVMLTDQDEQALDEAVSSLRETGVTADGAKLDVTSEAQWEGTVSTTINRLGGFDILVNNAGIQVAQLIHDLDIERASRLLSINVMGTALGLKHAFRAMRPGGAAGRGGSIVNLSSVAALTNTPGVLIYSASKSAVLRMTQVAAVEAGALEYGIRVNCLCPSLIKTELGHELIADFTKLGLSDSVDMIAEHVISRTPLRRFGSESDVANATLYLCSNEASFITGVALRVDGGFSLT